MRAQKRVRAAAGHRTRPVRYTTMPLQKYQQSIVRRRQRQKVSRNAHAARPVHATAASVILLMFAGIMKNQWCGEVFQKESSPENHGSNSAGNAMQSTQPPVVYKKTETAGTLQRGAGGVHAEGLFAAEGSGRSQRQPAVVVVGMSARSEYTQEQ